MLRVLLADDHALVRDGLRPFLEMLDDTIDLREADTLDAALIQFRPPQSPDLALLDLHMPGMNKFDGIRRLQSEHPTTKVVVVSGYFDTRTVDGAIAAGARGFIPKTTTGRAMLSALRSILGGDVYIPHGLLATGAINPLPRATSADAASCAAAVAHLTEREREILRYVTDGQTNKFIGSALALSEVTIKGHLRHVYRKIGATNRADAVRIALAAGLDAAT